MIKGLYIGMGTFSIAIGIIGIVVPLLPTTPFLLLSAACYAKGSERMYRWFINIKWIGNAIKNYHDGNGISIKGKIISILFLWTTILISMNLMWPNILIQLLLIIISMSVTYHIIKFKNNEEQITE
jgi:uncharacterized protein